MTIKGLTKIYFQHCNMQVPRTYENYLARFEKSIMKNSLINTFLIIGLFVGTIVTLSLYILSNSVLSVAAVPVIPQSLGNYKQWKEERNINMSEKNIIRVYGKIY